MTMPKELSSLIKEGNFNPSQVEVVEDGQNVMRPDVMNFLMLASVASQAVRIRKYFDDRKPTGRVDNFVIQATQTLQLTDLPYPGQAIAITNDGPNLAGIWINNHNREPHTMAVGEAYRVDFETHAIHRFYTQCDPGNTAQLRISVQE